ncbi:MAG: hypothetical protein JO281_22925 [Pseudonocardiales bacterium]|nr:hypothetical protein [Pseudonocardiales bacterium]
MTIHSAPSEAPSSGAPAETGLEIRSIAELVAAKLCGLSRVDDHFIRMDATVGDDGCIGVEVTRVYFNSENVTVRVLLQPTAPVPVPPYSILGPRSTA